MKQLDNYLRITLGLSALVWGATGRAGRLGSVLLTVAGAMKVAEGITGYRPVLHAITSMAMRRKPMHTGNADEANEPATHRHADGPRRNEAQWQPTGPSGSSYSGFR